MGLSGKRNIKLWPLGGDIMGQLDLSVFGEAYRVVALLDNDPGSSRARKKFTEKCSELQIPVHRLELYSLENYFTLSAITSVMGESPNKVSKLKPGTRVAEQLGYEVKRNGSKIAEQRSLAACRT